MRRGQNIAAPFDSPRILDEYAEKHGVKLLRYLSCPADDSDGEARLLAKSQMWSRDALMQAVMFLDMARRAGTLAALLERNPRFDRETRTFSTGGNPAAFLNGIGSGIGEKHSGKITEGVIFVSEKGTALLKPLKRGTGIRILAEALSAETAAELCDDIEKQLGTRNKA
jgi:mannose-1-phosphate guanylyltransferase/phosphomannomutase